MSSLVFLVFQHDSHGQYLPQSEEKLPLRNTRSLKNKEEVDFASTRKESHETQANTCILQCNNQAIELQLPSSLYPVNAASQIRTTWS